MNPILIVDDEKDNLEALQRLLRSQFKVTTTTSPFEALKLIQKEAYTVIVSDQRMPEMSGVEFLEKAKHVAPYSTRILLTGYTDVDSVIGAINRGNIYRYIAKPWDPEDLKLTLKQADEACILRKELEKKNQELIRSNDDLKEALAAVKTLDRAKARFVSLISHELNTPLTILNSYLTLLMEKSQALSADDQKSLKAIAGATQRLSEIVAEVISFVRLEMDPNFKLVEFDFEKESTGVLKDLSKELAARKLVIDFAAREKFSMKCDAEKMKMAIRRLVVEAIHGSPAGQKIEIGQQIKDSTFWFWVKRKGDPISKEALAPFEAGGDVMHHQKNLGLGLAMGKLIVEGHGGEIILESSQDAGTKLSFLFPIKR